MDIEVYNASKLRNQLLVRLKGCYFYVCIDW